MARQNKYAYMLILQGKYVPFEYGWEDMHEANRANPAEVKELRQDLRDYRKNAPQYQYRIIGRRVLNQEVG